MQETRKHFSDRIFPCLLILFVVTIFFPEKSKVNNIVIMLLAANWLAGMQFLHLRRLINQPVLLLLILFYLLHPLSLLYTENFHDGKMWLEFRLPLILIPLFIGTAKPETIHPRRLSLLFAFGTALISLTGIAFGIYRTVVYHNNEYLYSDHLGWLFDKQAVYFAAYINFSIAILLFYLHKNDENFRSFKPLAIVSILLMSITSYLLASRTAMVILVLLITGYIVFLVLSRKQYLPALILLFGLLVGGFMFIKVFPKTVKRFISIGNTEYVYDNTHPIDHFNSDISDQNWNSLNQRLAAWSCARAVIGKNLLLGTGIGDVQDELVSEYEKRNFHLGVHTRMNAHNQYLDVLLGFGVTGLIIFLAAYLLFPLYLSWHRKDFLLAFFVSATAVYYLTEVFLNRNQGIIFVVFFLVILSINRNDQDSVLSAS